MGITYIFCSQDFVVVQAMPPANSSPTDLRVQAVVLDPVQQRISRVTLPDVTVTPSDREQFGEDAYINDCRVEEILSCGLLLDAINTEPHWLKTLGLDGRSLANAYSQSRSSDDIGTVLFVGNKGDSGIQPGFRIGPAGKDVKATVYFGKGLLVRYSRSM